MRKKKLKVEVRELEKKLSLLVVSKADDESSKINLSNEIDITRFQIITKEREICDILEKENR